MDYDKEVQNMTKERREELIGFIENGCRDELICGMVVLNVLDHYDIYELTNQEALELVRRLHVSVFTKYAAKLVLEVAGFLERCCRHHGQQGGRGELLRYQRHRLSWLKHVAHTLVTSEGTFMETP